MALFLQLGVQFGLADVWKVAQWECAIIYRPSARVLRLIMLHQQISNPVLLLLLLLLPWWRRIASILI